MKKFYLLIFSVILLFAFATLSKYEDRLVLRSLDFAVTVKVQDTIDKSGRLRLAAVAANIMEGATFFASPEFTVIATLVITGWSVYDKKRKRWNLKAGVIPMGLVLLVIIEVIGKSVVLHPSPPFGMIKNPVSLFPADYINEQFSFPSGHAARAVFLAIAIGSVSATKFLPVFLLVSYVILVSVSRIYLGHHWFSDVIGGLLVGLSMGVLTYFSKDSRGNASKRSGS